MVKNFCINKVCLRGNVTSPLVYHHTFKDIKYYEFTISIMRYSGASDLIPVIVSEDVCANMNIECGKNILIKGKYRSYNDSTKKLLLYVYAKSITLCEDVNFFNNFVLKGTICKKGSLRTTPRGRVILDVMIADNIVKSRSSYIPCIIWNLTEEKAEEILIGSTIKVTGRIQSRDYQKKYEDGTSKIKTAYEISVKNHQIIQN